MVWSPFTRRRGRIFAIVVYNSNHVTDDDFAVSLNSTSIGTKAGTGNTVTGRVWTDSGNTANINGTNMSLTLDPPGPTLPYSFESTLALDFSLLVNGTNTLHIASTADNHAGNFGRVKIGYWHKNSGTGLWELVSALYDGTYSGSYPLSQDFAFTYP